MLNKEKIEKLLSDALRKELVGQKVSIDYKNATSIIKLNNKGKYTIIDANISLFTIDKYDSYEIYVTIETEKRKQQRKGRLYL